MDQADDYSMRPQMYNRQPTIPALSAANAYPPMHTNPYSPGFPRMAPALANPRFMGPQGPQSMGPGPMGQVSMGLGSMGPRSMGPRSMGPRPMGHSMYQNNSFSYNQPSVLRQLHPSNEQVFTIPEMDQGGGVRQLLVAPSAQGKSPLKPTNIPAKPAQVIFFFFANMNSFRNFKLGYSTFS